MRALSTVDTVTVTTNLMTGVHTARCRRCSDSATGRRYGWIADWASDHVCDIELAHLLARLNRRAA
jgi:hypothetical protein